MEQITKVFFDPLATTKSQISAFLKDLPIGSAHPFSPERILLCRTTKGIREIDVSTYSEDYFFNAVDLGELGETLLRRMAGFPAYLAVFNDYTIQQAPTSTFKIPIVSGRIAIFVVSELTPTYYDFCIADAGRNVCCWLSRDTFAGVRHSGDCVVKRDFLAYITIDAEKLTDKELAIFISGYMGTRLTRFLGSNPAVLIANNVDKLLYIVPVPLDAATIGKATMCCPLVVKRDGNSLICSILPTPTTDPDVYCSGPKIKSSSLPEALRRADFIMTTPVAKSDLQDLDVAPAANTNIGNAISASKNTPTMPSKPNAVISSKSTILPSIIDQHTTQIIRFGTGLEFTDAGSELDAGDTSTVILPCIFGAQLDGPVLLATGRVPANVPFSDERSLRSYYQQLRSVVVVVDDRMTDNARNLASSYRINALFVVQVAPKEAPKTSSEILALLNSVNINAVTALAGPQSLILVSISEKYYFYRGIANRLHLNTATLAFGSDITDMLEVAGMESIIDPRVKRIVNLDESNAIIFPSTGQFVKPQDLRKLFEDFPVDQIATMEEDIVAAVPQLQALMNQTDLQQLSNALINILYIKTNNVIAPVRKEYIHFITKEFKAGDPDSLKMKNDMLGKLRKETKSLQKAVESATSSLANMMSSQTTSKRTHDLNRLQRQTTIQNNVEATKNMTFEKLAEMLENHAGEMGMMVMNIETTPYRQLLETLKDSTMALDASSCCDLDSRILHLEGFDAGILIEQSQSTHDGPLRNQQGPAHPILALPYLSQNRGPSGSMLAWVCWDEFVNLDSPFNVRWMEKCNDAHIAALRIMMRDTLSHAVVCREHNFQAGSSEIGHLMSALLMAAMSKLAAMRTTAPGVMSKAEDTVTKLMRGLFANLLTIAGSGVRPLSMVWQLFGKFPHFDIPSSVADWSFYETVVALYPYTGWPLQQFHSNLEKLIDKAVVRVVTKNEKTDEVKANLAHDLAKYCKLRNIQLEHSRTILTIFMKLLTNEDMDRKAIAQRLLKNVPHSLEKETVSYTRMIKYLEHLANGGDRRTQDDLVAASVFTKRSATFRKIKEQIASACESQDEAKIKTTCQKLLDKHAKIAQLWCVVPETLKVQNMKAYQGLLTAKYDDIDTTRKAYNKKIFSQAIGDAEQRRIPWQVGKKGEFGNDIEPLDETFIHEILTGKSLDVVATFDNMKDATVKVVVKQEEQRLAHFSSVLSPKFIGQVEKAVSPEDVCGIIGVPTSAMRVFAKALNPDLVWEELAQNFKGVILSLVKARSNRLESHPTRRLLGMGSPTSAILVVEQLQIAE
ncbi:hypothetical protein LOCC1_G004792 [Lachnellula occidentalis]|uniref:Uncharacterized protein n=1 Tax=Lachnellula occidentalis TaxID=215460 RepID=A0A8H8S1M5_9HELO|nr:hypothetical protein LOCC1_G004792 [Lachnellula occidentalis]